MASIGQYDRDNMLKAMKEHARGHIAKHAMNVEIYLKNGAGVGEHPVLAIHCLNIGEKH